MFREIRKKRNKIEDSAAEELLQERCSCGEWG